MILAYKQILLNYESSSLVIFNETKSKIEKGLGITWGEVIFWKKSSFFIIITGKNNNLILLNQKCSFCYPVIRIHISQGDIIGFLYWPSLSVVL